VATPKKRGGHVVFRLCGEAQGEAEVSQHVLTKSNPHFGALKAQSKWGSLLPLTALKAKGRNESSP